MCAVLVPEDLFAPGELTPDSFTYGIIFSLSLCCSIARFMLACLLVVNGIVQFEI
jgi:hypothetical protein